MKSTRTLASLALAASLATLGVHPVPAAADASGWAAYRAEHKAYVHEAALVAQYKHETQVQRRMVIGLEQQLRGRMSRVADASVTAGGSALAPDANGSYGWGTL